MHRSRPGAPLFTARVDERYAVIRVRGHLDRLAAEDIVTCLQRLYRAGHGVLTVEVQSLATADAEAAAMLADLAARLADEGVLLAIA